MASQYLKNIAGRRSIYALTKESTISNARLQEILTETIKHSPSSFNNQAGRAVLLLGDSHDKLWALAEETVKSKLPPQAYDGLKPKIYGYKNGYGTIMFFEAAEALKPYKDAHPEMPFDEWSDHSAGKHSLSTRYVLGDHSSRSTTSITLCCVSPACQRFSLLIKRPRLVVIRALAIQNYSLAFSGSSLQQAGRR